MKKIFAFFSLFIFNKSIAQEINTLEPVNISNSRTLQKNSVTGKNITVVDGKLFEKLPVISLDDLLKYVPGVEIQQRGHAGSQADIIIRGGTFQQILVLIDGVKLNDPITGHFSGYIPITPAEIERIEIIKGPAAAMYGSEAVGGLINIISKINYAYKKEKKLNITAGAIAGEYGLINGSAHLYSTGEKLNFSLAAFTNNATGQLLRSNNRGYFNNHTFSGSIARQFGNRWQFSLQSSYDIRDFAAQNFYTTFLSDTATEKVSTFWNHAQLKKIGNNNSDQFDGVYKNTLDNYSFNKSAIANENRSELMLLQYLHTGQLNKNINFVYGTMLEHRKINSNDRGNHSNNHAAIFGSSVIQLNNFSINPGLRLVNDQNYGNEVLPQLNASYSVKKLFADTTARLVFRGGAGRSLRSADFTERFNNYNKPLVKSGTIGNPDLVAERSWSYEIGGDITWNNFRFSATGFYRSQRQLIDYVITPYADMPRKTNLDPAGTYSLAKNIKTADTKGLEFEIAWQKSFCKDIHLNLVSSALFLDTKTSDATPSFYILSHAKLLLQQYIMFRYKNLELSFNGLYKERAPQSETRAGRVTVVQSVNYAIGNGRVQYNLKKISGFVMVNNIGDRQYTDLLGSKMPGRWTSGGIIFKL